MNAEWRDFVETAATLLDPKTYVQRFYEHRTRPDGRLFSQARSTTIQQGILTRNAVGSALVTFQSLNPDSTTRSTTTTVVLAAITLQVGQPTTWPDCPAGQGDVVVTVVDNVKGMNESSGTGSTTSSPINVVILQSFLQRVLDACIEAAQDCHDNNNDSQEPQTHPLVLIPGKSALRLMVSVQVLQAAGNVVDACVLACVAALLDAKIPTSNAIHVAGDGKTVWWKHDYPNDNSNNNNVDNEKDATTKRLRLPILPIPLTLGLWVPSSDSSGHDETDDQRIIEPAPTSNPCWIVDPDHWEEECLSTTLTVVVNGGVASTQQKQSQQVNDDDPLSVLLIDLSGTTACRTTDLALALQMAKGRAKELRNILLAD